MQMLYNYRDYNLFSCLVIYKMTGDLICCIGCRLISSDISQMKHYMDVQIESGHLQIPLFPLFIFSYITVY